MNYIYVAGYRALFGEPNTTYEDLLKDLPSEVVISIAISFNNELDANLPPKEIQSNLLRIISSTFSPGELAHFNNAYHKLNNNSSIKIGEYVFGKRYLLAMVLKELNRNFDIEIKDVHGPHHFNFFKAYLLVVDEVNQLDDEVLPKATKSEQDFNEYRPLWTNGIMQYQHNESVNILFELFKVSIFLKYALEHYRNFLREYLSFLGFRHLGAFMKSITEITKSRMKTIQSEPFSKSLFIVPENGAITTPLEKICINKQEYQPILMPHLKKHPLFYNKDRGYMVVDETLYFKTIYRGAYFQLFRNTELKSTSFSDYSKDISTFVLEKQCFKSILDTFPRKKYDTLNFDDGTDAHPDCYYRHNNEIFLIEFKANIFPDDLLFSEGAAQTAEGKATPDLFLKIKKYLDERLIKNEKGKAKGITQIIKQLNLLKRDIAAFDPTLKIKKTKSIIIYPVICIDEFYFTMPGVNDYINKVFSKMIPLDIETAYTIKNLTIVGAEILYDLSINDNSFQDFKDYIDRYWKILENRKRIFINQNNVTSFYNSMSSFDEIYNSIFLKERPKNKNMAKIKSKILQLNALGLSESQLVETV